MRVVFKKKKCLIVSSEQDLLDLIPGSYVGQLFPKASNLKDLVVHAYKVNNMTFSFTWNTFSPSTQGRLDEKEKSPNFSKRSQWGFRFIATVCEFQFSRKKNRGLDSGICSGMRLRRGIISPWAQQCIVLPKIHWSRRTEACFINSLWLLGQKCCERQSASSTKLLFLACPFPPEPA